MSAPSISGSIAFSIGTQTRPVFSISCSTLRGRARWTRRWFQITTSTIRGQSPRPTILAHPSRKPAVLRKNSAYWEANEAQTLSMADFFLKSTAPHKLKDAPGGTAYLSKDESVLHSGKIVFAERCARCHSSKLPDRLPGLDPGGCSGK